MENKKEIYIEIDESGKINSGKQDQYIFIVCSFISSKQEINSKAPFHFRGILHNSNISDEEKRNIFYKMGKKIENKNCFYGLIKINKHQFNKEDITNQMKKEISSRFLNILLKITKNNNLKINVIYDKGQYELNEAIRNSISLFELNNPSKSISFINRTILGNINHGYCDFICSVERLKIKFNDNQLNNYEKRIFNNGSFINVLQNCFSNKNIDNLQFDNFEELLFPESDGMISTDDDTDDPPDIP